MNHLVHFYVPFVPWILWGRDLQVFKYLQDYYTLMVFDFQATVCLLTSMFIGWFFRSKCSWIGRYKAFRTMIDGSLGSVIARWPKGFSLNGESSPGQWHKFPDVDVGICLIGLFVVLGGDNLGSYLIMPWNGSRLPKIYDPTKWPGPRVTNHQTLLWFFFPAIMTGIWDKTCHGYIHLMRIYIYICEYKMAYIYIYYIYMDNI